jgi:hypothetical protein
MSPTSVYRSNAENCLRIATAAQDERDKPFWLSLAQSWLHLAERAARGGTEIKVEGQRVGGAM